MLLITGILISTAAFPAAALPTAALPTAALPTATAVTAHEVHLGVGFTACRTFAAREMSTWASARGNDEPAHLHPPRTPTSTPALGDIKGMGPRPGTAGAPPFPPRSPQLAARGTGTLFIPPRCSPDRGVVTVAARDQSPYNGGWSGRVWETI